MSLPPEIINAIKKAEKLTSSTFITCIACEGEKLNLEYRIRMIDKYGIICEKCQREAGVMW